MNIKEIVKSILYFLLLTAVLIGLRQFVFTPVVVKGDSMAPTLIDGERVIALKNTKIQRFDIVTFPAPDDPGKNYIKRVIGLPGDTIEYKNDTLYINGEQSEEPYLTEFKKDLTDNQPLTYDFNLKEVIGSEKVPTGELFVLGDNRRISKDSRIIGLIKEKDIMADVKFVFWPFERFGTID
ncbi:signal peptidase I [Enterococcus dongliensis]|uniref:Signal peptidase I n=1 Tax=Enterococcus dongliensis TaxID=2559925 RepID=A0AAP5NJJ7_9ENTE|nr:signal peptidase I [Enterococcus dongliensis]MDT2595700.1 signal peptidase I [Enterococcus dongliensis]MDT2602660.1 signal peptidase I [Enterococcus dongliensis]MDT2633852.1 signal peptidase I [Enterococcus dongliensis]MDT2636313.1 signal peptidase I [Enterococcus dongliensis]MDT2641534.1 signal peptidase I [Enterococcus dongliensis]